MIDDGGSTSAQFMGSPSPRGRGPISLEEDAPISSREFSFLS